MKKLTKILSKWIYTIALMAYQTELFKVYTWLIIISYAVDYKEQFWVKT